MRGAARQANARESVQKIQAARTRARSLRGGGATFPRHRLARRAQEYLWIELEKVK
jgi:hypothetical protein